MRQPNIFTASEIKKWPNETETTSGRWVPARPLGGGCGRMLRWELAFGVLTGRLDALSWEEQTMSDEMKQEPLPCPFCGSKANIRREGANHIVTCAGPGCYISMRVISECRILAVAKWNTRPDSKPEQNCKSFCKLFSEAKLKEEFWQERCEICKEEAVIACKPYKWSQVDMVWENGGAKMKMGMKDWLVGNGFDGLYVTGTCACLVDDLGPCGSLPYSCKPGYKHMDPRPEHIGDWAIFGEKETPDEDEWEHVGY